MKKTFTVTASGFRPEDAPDVQGDIQLALDRALSYDVEVAHLLDVEEEEEHDGPLVSILLPNYNYAHRVGRMIASLRAQNVKDFELIVVDDGSSDDSVAKIRPLLGLNDRLLIHGKNRGAAEAINTAARAARGKYMTWVSADNEMTPGWLGRLLEIFGDLPDTGVAYANYDRFQGQGYNKETQDPRTWGKPYNPTGLITDQNCFIGPAFLVRADVWRAVGDLRGKISCDYDHWLRIEEECQRRQLQFQYTEVVLCHYYAGEERITVTRRHEYDAGVWQAEARKRRSMGIVQATVVS